MVAAVATGVSVGVGKVSRGKNHGSRRAYVSTCDTALSIEGRRMASQS
jgi:hypothetical protein